MSTKLELILTLTIRDLYRFDKLNILSKSKDLITNSINIYNKSLLEKITDYVNQQKIEANHLCDDKKFDESLKILLNIPKSKYDLDIYSLFINNYIALDKDEQAIPYLNELITLFENGHISITADEKIDWYGKSKRLYKRLCKTENEQYVSNYHLYAKKEIDIRKKTLNLNDNDLLRVEQEHLLSDCYNEYAWFLREQKQYVDAIKYCDKARKLNPEDDDTWNLKGLCFLELNEDKKALKSFNQAIKLNNKDASIWSNKGFALFRLKNYTEALKCNNEAIKLSPNNDAFLQGKKIIKKALEDENIDKVRTLINEQQYEDALDLINFVLKSNPQSEITWNIKGNCLLNLNMPDDEIMKCFDKAIELNNDYSIAYHNKGFLLDRQQNYKEALAYYDKAIELSPNYEIAITNREDLLQKLSDISIDTIIDLIDQQDYENALSDIDNYLILNSSNETIWNLKANCFLYLYDYEEAVVCYNNFIELNDKDELIWNNRGICLTDLEHYDEAINSFNKSIELNPNNEYVWFNKGYALFYSNNENEAIICFEKAIDLNSENEWSWSYKGNCLQNLEKYEESLIYYNKSIELYSGDESVWSNKGLSLLYLERYEEAIICCDKSIELNSENEIAWYWKGCCLSDMQQYEEAIACYDEAIRINPDNEHYLLQKEKCLFNMNNNIK